MAEKKKFGFKKKRYVCYCGWSGWEDECGITMTGAHPETSDLPRYAHTCKECGQYILDPQIVTVEVN